MSCPDCTPTQNCPACQEHLEGEVERTILVLEDQCGNPTVDDEERAEAREASDYLAHCLESWRR